MSPAAQRTQCPRCRCPWTRVYTTTEDTQYHICKNSECNHTWKTPRPEIPDKAGWNLAKAKSDSQ